MRVLCCLDGYNIAQLSNALSTVVQPASLEIGLIYVTDTGPHAEMERMENQRGRFLRQPGMTPARREQVRQAEEATAQDILNEGARAFPGAERIQRAGRPEREIVNLAAEWKADLILICPRTAYDGNPSIGPKSVGHVARFVLDHAPCPVLLVRPVIRGQFPLAR